MSRDCLFIQKEGDNNLEAQSRAVWSVLNSFFKMVPSNVGGSLSGHVTLGGLSRVFQKLLIENSSTKPIHFVDLGSGEGYPVFTASLYPKVQLSVGIEVGELSVFQAKTVQGILEKKNLIAKNTCYFIEKDILKLTPDDLKQFTHLYSFVSAFPLHVVEKVVYLLINTPSITVAALSEPRRVAGILDAMNAKELFKLEHSFSIRMSGSGEGRMFGIWKRIR